MALVLADRVRDTTTTTGTGTVTLSGTAPTGYQTFGAAIGNGNTTYYTINAGSQWEVGLGTYSSTGPTLARTTVLASSNGGSLVDFSTGTKDVFVTYPAEEAVYQDGSSIKAGTAILGVPNGGTGVTTSTGTVAVVLSNSPTLVTPVLGAASATSIANALGAVGTPSYTFTGDTNTGIFSPAADTLAFVEGGVEAMRIDSSGNVGIGTSSPSSRLTITGGNTEIRDGNYLLLRPSGNAWDMRLQATGTQLDILSGGALGSPIMSLLNGGNVGIGTSSPGSKLDVVAQDAIRATGFQPFLTLRDSSDSNKGSRIQTASAITIFYNDTTGGGTYTERMRIDSSGNVGIGTASPSAKLDVNGDLKAGNTVSIGLADTSPTIVNVGTGATGNKFAIIDFIGDTTYTDYGLRIGRLNNGANGTSEIQHRGTGALNLNCQDAGTMTFATNATERMRIDSSGNVGIGTTSPAAKLDVVGIVSARSDISTGNSPLVAVNTNTGSNTTKYTSLLFQGYDTVGTGKNVGLVLSGPSDANYVTSYMAFQTRSGDALSERMRIDSSGNVGIGTSSPAYKLDVSGQEFNFGAGGTTTNAYMYLNSGTSSSYGPALRLRRGGTDKWWIGLDSGINGGTSEDLDIYTGSAVNMRVYTSGAERMRITSAGYLLVGTTTTLGGNTSNEFKTTTAGSWPLTINSNDRGILHRQSSGTTGFYEYFEYNGGTNNGSISYSGGTTAYNTTSDYRLKKIDGPITNSGAYIDALNPVQGIWKADGTRFVGLVAHEVQEVSSTPVVTGEKDGEMMQQMDYSSPEIIANLIAEVQSLRARVAQLEGN